MIPDFNVLSLVVPAGTAVTALLVRQYFAERRSRRSGAVDRLEQRRKRLADQVQAADQRDHDRIELILAQWKTQVEEWREQLKYALARAEAAEEREAECQRRCEELARRMNEQEINLGFCEAHITKLQRDLDALLGTGTGDQD